MQLRYVLTETSIGLRRNLSMTIALIVTIFVSLTLVAMGLLLNAQAAKAEAYWGSQLQITVWLCNQNSRGPNCGAGEVTDAQKEAITSVLDQHPEVASWRHESQAEAFATWKRVYVAKDETEKANFATVTAEDMHESYRVTLVDPKEYSGIQSALKGRDGVDAVRDLREILDPIYRWINVMKWGAIGVAGFLLVAAVLQVGNSIRLAALARRREISIMRLVGASRLYISLPFLLEMFVAAALGVLMAAACVAAFMWFVVEGQLRPNHHILEWINWDDGLEAIAQVGILGLALTLFPTLLLTRKYLKV